MKRRMIPAVVAAGGFILAGSTARAANYAEDFQVDPTADWVVNAGPTDHAVDFFFDYSTVGIPLAPNSGAGAARGMKLQANLSDGVFGGFSVSPSGQNFTGPYAVMFDWWANFNGPLPAGGSGATNLSTFGVGTAGTAAQWPSVADGVWFGATGDGGSAADWRAYSSAATISYVDGDPVYAADTRNHTDPYYAGFGGVSVPAQAALFPQQAGVTSVGTAGLAWHEVVIENDGDEVTWTVDGRLIAAVDLSTVTLAGENIFFGHSDTNASSSVDANARSLLFTLIDNVARVVPEPAGAAAWAVTAGAILLRRRHGTVRRA